MEKLNATFTDSQNVTWSLTLDASTVREIQSQTTINLTDLKSDPFEKMSLDPILLADVIWMICEKQSTAKGVTADEFYRRLAECIDDAVVALEAAVINFFPASKRSFLQSLRSKNAEMTERATAKAMEELTASQTQIESAMTRQMQRELRRVLETIDSASDAESPSAT